MRGASPDRRARDYLGSRLEGRFRGLLWRRAALWLHASLLLLVFASLIGLLLPGAGAAAGPFALLLCLSLFPAFLAWPASLAWLDEGLRALDREACLESWLDAPEGPARSLLEAKVGRESEALATRKARRENPLRGLGKLSLLVLIAILVLELLSFGLLGRATLPGAPQELPAEGSGLLIAEEAPARHNAPAGGVAEGEEKGPAGEEEARGLGGGEPEELAAEGEASGGTASRLEKAEEASGGEAAPSAARDKAPDAGAASPAPRQPGEAGRKQAPEAPTAPARGEAASAGEDLEGEGSPGQGESRGRGWERSGSNLGASPLVDYRARLIASLVERGAMPAPTSAAVEELSLAELRDYERRYFGSFSLPAGLSPREDAYATLLRRRWAELLRPLRGGGP